MAVILRQVSCADLQVSYNPLVFRLDKGEENNNVYKITT